MRALMLVAVPVVVYGALLLWWVRRGEGWRWGALHAATTWAALAVLLSETLSLGGWLTPAGLARGWLGTSAVVLAGVVASWRRASRRETAGDPGSTAASRSGTVEIVLLAGVIALVGAAGVTAVLSPPNTWDAMQYHLPRVVHWLSHGHLSFYPTHDPKQLHMAPGAELLMLQLHGLWGGDRLDNLVQWLAYVGSIVAASLAARSLGAGRRGQVLAAVFCATIPQGILQASGAKNDFVLAFWMIVLVSYVLRFGAGPSPSLAVGMAVTAGLAVLTKATALLFAAPLALLWLTWPPAARRAAIRSLPLLLLAVVGLNGAHFLRNHALYGWPLGPGAESTGGDFKYTNDAMSPTRLAANILRNAALHGATASVVLDRWIERRVARAIRALGGHPDDPATTWTNTTFSVPKPANHESATGNPAHLLLIALSLGWLGFGGWRRHPPSLTGLSAAVVLGFVLFCAVLRWQPWHVRLHLPLFVLWSPVVGVMLAALRPRALGGAVAMALLAVAAPMAVANQLRPLVGPGAQSVWRGERIDGYFAERQSLRDRFIEVVRTVRETGCRHIGLVLPSGEHYEYPLLMLLGAEHGDMRIRHVAVENASRRYDHGEPPVTPCAIVCDRCSRRFIRVGDVTYGRQWVVESLAVLLPRPVAPALLAATVRLEPETHAAREQQHVQVGLEAHNPDHGEPADLYVGVVLPDGDHVLVADEQGRLHGPLPMSRPAAVPRTAEAPPGFSLQARPFITLVPSMPTPGSRRYRIFALLTRRDALADGRLDPQEIVASDTHELQVQR